MCRNKFTPSVKTISIDSLRVLLVLLSIFFYLILHSFQLSARISVRLPPFPFLLFNCNYGFFVDFLVSSWLYQKGTIVIHIRCSIRISLHIFTKSQTCFLRRIGIIEYLSFTHFAIVCFDNLNKTLNETVLSLKVNAYTFLNE